MVAVLFGKTTEQPSVPLQLCELKLLPSSISCVALAFSKTHHSFSISCPDAYSHFVPLLKSQFFRQSLQCQDEAFLARFAIGSLPRSTLSTATSSSQRPTVLLHWQLSASADTLRPTPQISCTWLRTVAHREDGSSSFVVHLVTNTPSGPRTRPNSVWRVVSC